LSDLGQINTKIPAIIAATADIVKEIATILYLREGSLYIYCFLPHLDTMKIIITAMNVTNSAEYKS